MGLGLVESRRERNVACNNWWCTYQNLKLIHVKGDNLNGIGVGWNKSFRMESKIVVDNY